IRDRTVTGVQTCALPIYLTAYAPGDLGVVYRPGLAKKIPKGASLAFQMHYTPNGTEQTDCSSVGLIFAKEPPVHEVRTRGIDQKIGRASCRERVEDAGGG